MPKKKSLKRLLIIWSGLRILSAIDRVLTRFSPLPEQDTFPRSTFPWIRHLEDNWTLVQADAERILTSRHSIPPVREISPDHDMIAINDRWRSFFLRGYGLRHRENCLRCPETARLLEDIPGLLTAFFSILEPGAHIPCHTGPTKAILTAHLGLRVPHDRAACRMRIGDRDVTWRQGELLLFDDMYPHEVWNDTDEDRVVLLLQIRRPERFPASLLRDGLLVAMRHSPFVQDALRKLEMWPRKQA
ncbi:MAG TPA: aspartyl/asparaginyl beta-hydroxylase domain-containing protein [Woeseiaceae bacterium]|nr:aspartyl/asparaginyl beta-hydroxylase domain-containing protein [Woeseiaceae bacterium]